MGDSISYLYEPEGTELHWDGLKVKSAPQAISLLSSGLAPSGLPVHPADRQTGMQGSNPSLSQPVAKVPSLDEQFAAMQAQLAGRQATLSDGPAVKRISAGDASNGYNTQLTDGAQAPYHVWLDKVAPGDPGRDYDYAGAFAAGQGRGGPDGHFTDQFKKPNHETFSDESQYADQGPHGSWQDDNFTPGAGQPPAWLAHYMNNEGSDDTGR